MISDLSAAAPVLDQPASHEEAFENLLCTLEVFEFYLESIGKKITLEERKKLNEAIVGIMGTCA